MKNHLLAATLAIFTGAEAHADHYFRTADPNVINALNQMFQILGQGCNFGNTAACNASMILQQQAHYMLAAGYDCAQNNIQQACAFYNQNYWQLDQAYGELLRASQSGGLVQNTGGGQGMGLTHEQRMQQIHAFGEQSTANFNARQAAQDASHQQFMQTIWE